MNLFGKKRWVWEDPIGLMFHSTKDDSVSTDVNTSPSYHDVYITTSLIKRTSIFDLPYGYVLHCSRARGWSLWYNQDLVAGEFEADSEKFLVIDVNGHVILDTRENREDS